MQGRIWAAVTLALCLAVPGGEAQGDAGPPPSGKYRAWYFVDREGTGHFGEMIVAAELKPRLEAFRGRPIEIDITRAYRNFTVGPYTIDAFASVEALPAPPMSIQLWSRPSSESPGAVEVYCTVTKAKGFPAGDDSGPDVDVWWAGYREIRTIDPAGAMHHSKWFRGEYCSTLRAPALRIAGSYFDRGTSMGPGESMTYLIDKLAGLEGACDVGVRVTFRRGPAEPIVGEARMPIDLPAVVVPADEPR